MSHEYKLKYDLKTEFGKFTAEEVQAEGKGATDAFVFASMIYPADGSFSLQVVTSDGRNEGAELDDNEVFKVWAMIAAKLSESRTLAKGKKGLCADVFALVAEAAQANQRPRIIT